MSDTCKHCQLPIVLLPHYNFGRRPQWWHESGSRTCTSAVADVHVGDWTDMLMDRREALRGKTPCPAW